MIFDEAVAKLRKSGLVVKVDKRAMAIEGGTRMISDIMVEHGFLLCEDREKNKWLVGFGDDTHEVDLSEHTDIDLAVHEILKRLSPFLQ